MFESFYRTIIIPDAEGFTLREPSASAVPLALAKVALFKDAEGNVSAVPWNTAFLLTSLYYNNQSVVVSLYAEWHKETNSDTPVIVASLPGDFYRLVTDEAFMAFYVWFIERIPSAKLKEWYSIMDVEFLTGEKGKAKAKND